jgi:Carboxypeptidase regulatory-like domain
MQFRCTLLCAFVLASMPAWSQRITASLGGIVRDPTQATVPGATIIITNSGTASAFRTVTDRDGRFQAPSLRPVSTTFQSKRQGSSAWSEKV